MNLSHTLEPGKNPPDEINVVIEIPKASSIKYELDEISGAIFVDRKLFTAMFYPCNYGFIPRTREGDGDPVDVLVLGNDAVVPMSVIRAHPVGVLVTEDENGRDSKIIAVPTSKIDPSFSNISDIDAVPDNIKSQIKHFFEHYKELEPDKFVKVTGWKDKNEAKACISHAIERYLQEKGDRDTD